MPGSSLHLQRKISSLVALDHLRHNSSPNFFADSLLRSRSSPQIHSSATAPLQQLLHCVKSPLHQSLSSSSRSASTTEEIWRRDLHLHQHQIRSGYSPASNQSKLLPGQATPATASDQATPQEIYSPCNSIRSQENSVQDHCTTSQAVFC